MLCDECKTNAATVHLVSIVNGQRKERNLCPNCAHTLGADSFMPFSWGDIFPTTAMSFGHPREAACSVCGSTLSDISRTGLVGCENCYRDLRSGLLPIIARVQTKARHSGRSPIGYEAKKLTEPTERIPENESEEAKLKRELDEAVKSENYERAAELRDRIRAVKKEGNDVG